MPYELNNISKFRKKILITTSPQFFTNKKSDGINIPSLFIVIC